MSVTYKGSESVSPEEREKLEVELSTQELHSMIKTLYYAKNGFNVGFSVIFNTIASGNSTKERAYHSIDLLSAEFKRALDRYFDGELEKDSVEENGVRVTRIRPASKLN